MSAPPGERPAGAHAASSDPAVPAFEGEPAARASREDGPDPAPRVSVIVPAYDSAAFIRGCLRALDAQTLPPDAYEVIVVDDGSTDSTAEEAERYAADARARIRVLREPENRGPAAARNTGIAASRAPVFAFTDADCEVAPDWLERGLARLDADDLAGVEGRTDPAGPVGTLTHQMRNESGGLWMTCNMLYRREALGSAGGFDERFRSAFLEDSDVAFAVQEVGGAIAFDPEVVVNHLVLQEGRRKFWRDARKRYYNPLLYAKHPALYAQHIAPVVPGLPRLHLLFMAWTLAPFLLWAIGLPGGSVLAALVWAFYLRRLAHAYRARDAASIAQVALVPFVQTYWVLRGAVAFRAFSWKL